MHNRTSKQRKAAQHRRAHYATTDAEIERRLARSRWEAAQYAHRAQPPKRSPPPPKPPSGRIPKRKVEIVRVARKVEAILKKNGAA